jgi:hypothetical protein
VCTGRRRRRIHRQKSISEAANGGILIKVRRRQLFNSQTGAIH